MRIDYPLRDNTDSGGVVDRLAVLQVISTAFLFA